MELFMVMIIFITICVICIKFAQSLEDEWAEFERLANDTTKMRSLCEDLEARESNTKMATFGYSDQKLDRVLDYLALRAEFVNPRDGKGKLAPDFDFADYLTCCLTNHLTEMIEVPLTTWAFTEGVLIVIYGILLIINGDRNTMFWILMCSMFLNCGALYALNKKMSWIGEQLVAKGRSNGAYGQWYLGYWFLGVEVPVGADPEQFESKLEDRPQPLYLVNSFKNRITSRSYLGAMLMGDKLPNAHESLFWLDRQGLEWIQWYERCCLLMLAAYLPVCGSMLISEANERLDDVTFLSAEGAVAYFTEIVKCLVFAAVWLTQFKLVLNIIENNFVYNVEMMKTQENIVKVKADQLAVRAMTLMSMLNKLRCFSKINKDQGKVTAEDAKAIEAEIDPKWKDFIEQNFALFDTDQSGYLEPEEFKNFMHTIGQDPSDEAAKSLIAVLDQDGDGQVSCPEFVTWMWLQKKANGGDGQESLEEVAHGIFSIFDKDNTGSITVSEFSETLSVMGFELSLVELNTLVGVFDRNNGGDITSNEFAEVLEQYEFQP